jgi:mannose-6-phosphate isomerase-like protein (cupin superfamily)
MDIIGLNNKKDLIRNRTVFHDHLTDREEINWDLMMSLIDSHPKSLWNWNGEIRWLGLNDFHKRDLSPDITKNIVAEMEEIFVKNSPKKKQHEMCPQQISNIAFVGIGPHSGSFSRHKDMMDVLLYQAIGKVPITIGKNEEPSEKDLQITLNPGDYVWIPRGWWHKLNPINSRVTFSFGVEGDFDPATYV